MAKPRGKGETVDLSDFGAEDAEDMISVETIPADTEPAYDKRKLDDVMLAMDVVDTLRHDAILLEQDLSAPEREQQLIERLRVIYKKQGIEVPDRILREGVQALDDHRFAYAPQKGGFISKAYINRGKWGKPLLVALGMIGLAVGLEYAVVEMPKNREVKRVERVLENEVPKSLDIAKSAAAKAKISALYEDGKTALAAGDTKAAKRISDELTTMSEELRQSFTVRIVSRPGENSGVFRLHDDNANVRNYYLIVEGIGANGKAKMVTIVSEEDQETKRTDIWGVRVSKDVFNRVAADKKDDQIIQNAVIGTKKTGYLQPDYSIKTTGGLIVEW